MRNICKKLPRSIIICLITLVMCSLVYFGGFCFAADKAKKTTDTVEKKEMEPAKVLAWIRSLAERLPVDLAKGDSVSNWWPFTDGTVYKYRIIKSFWGWNEEWVGTEFTIKFVKSKDDPHRYTLQAEGFDKWPYKELVVRKNRLFVTRESSFESPLIVFPLFQGMLYWNEKYEYDFIKKAIKFKYKDGFYAPASIELWCVDSYKDNCYEMTQMLHRPLHLKFEKSKGITEWRIPGGLTLELME